MPRDRERLVLGEWQWLWENKPQCALESVGGSPSYGPNTDSDRVGYDGSASCWSAIGGQIADGEGEKMQEGPTIFMKTKDRRNGFQGWSHYVYEKNVLSGLWPTIPLKIKIVRYQGV